MNRRSAIKTVLAGLAALTFGKIPGLKPKAHPFNPLDYTGEWQWVKNPEWELAEYEATFIVSPAGVTETLLLPTFDALRRGPLERWFEVGIPVPDAGPFERYRLVNGRYEKVYPYIGVPLCPKEIAPSGKTTRS